MLLVLLEFVLHIKDNSGYPQNNNQQIKFVENVPKFVPILAEDTANVNE